MANLSQIKREKLLAFLETLKEQHSDDESLIALGQIEKELKSKKYGLVWEEHEEAVDEQMKTQIPVFTEVKEREISADEGGAYNFLLEGDNLHSLYLLEKTHKGAIDVIYIDPPYNKDKDFIYNDNYIDKNDTFRHSKWASFMFKRLRLASELLSSHGGIFISCDDNELPSLRMICDEIFGEANFEGHIHWRRRHNQPNDKTKLIAIVAEHILVYSKNAEKHKAFGVGKVEITGNFSNPDNDPRGPWASKPWKSGSAQSGCTYSITTPTGKVLTEEWLGEEKTFKSLLADGRIVFPRNGNGSPRKKYYASERAAEGQCATNWWLNDLFGCNQDATNELKDIFVGICPFDNPKPTKLINSIIRLGCIDKNATILDFFAGSGTTGHAVLKLNTEDGGHRKFILCTNNENNICEEVTYERIKRVINGYGDTEGIPANLKYFKTDFVDKESEELSDELLEHITEMIELEHGIKVDNQKYIMIMTDEEMDEFEQNVASYPDLKAVFVNQDILLSATQQKLLDSLAYYVIPNYYFDFELREAGELW